MKRRVIKCGLVTATSVCVTAGIAAGTASASVPNGYTETTQQTVTYMPGGDAGTFCDAAVKGYGVGGGCFKPDGASSYVDATLKDQATSNTAGEIIFQQGANAAAMVLGVVYFCGDSGPILIPGDPKASPPTATTDIFVGAMGPLGSTVLPTVGPTINTLPGSPWVNFGPNCGNTAFGTTGKVTLTQLIPTPPPAS
jgi:hypothetical protein